MTSLIVSVASLFVAFVALLLALGAAIKVRRMNAVQSGLRLSQLSEGSELPERVWDGLVSNDVAAGLTVGDALISIVSSTCQPCKGLVAGLNSSKASFGGTKVVIVETGEAEDSLRSLLDFESVWVSDRARRLPDRLGVGVTPYSILLRDGRVLSQAAGSDISPLIGQMEQHHQGQMRSGGVSSLSEVAL